MNRRLKAAAKRGAFYVHKGAARCGVHVLPVHYYSPVADVNELERTRDVWARTSDLPGIHFDLDEQLDTLRGFCLPFQDEYAGNPAYRHATQNAFGPGYGYVEAQALHAVIRSLKPRRVVEVGSGVSTYCMLEALKANERETGDGFELTSIEPHPSARLRALPEITLMDQSVQTVPLEFFEGFGEGDFLFIDSSHVVKPGSDVNFLVLEVLPRLNPGAVVHVHDINLPYDYTRLALQTYFQWNETSLLRAFLINNDRARILFCLSALHYDRQDALKEIFPEYRPQADAAGLRSSRYKPFEHPADEHFPSSIYIRIQ